MKLERNSRGRATIPKDLEVQITPEKTDSHALTRQSPRGSTPNMMAGVRKPDKL